MSQVKKQLSNHTLCLSLGLMLLGGCVASQQSLHEQAAEIYAAQCLSCHGDAMQGGAASPLKGPGFVAKWSDFSAADLSRSIQTRMPPGAVQPLSEEVAKMLANLIMSENALSGNAPVQVQADPAKNVAQEEKDSHVLSAREKMRSVAAQLKPVTDEMIKSPPKEDWLLWRGDIGVHGFSALEQINTDNVAALRLVWSRTLGPGTGGIAPLVHDGVLFVHGGGQIAALDAISGDLIWGVRDTATPRGVSQPRGLALYDRALYASTVDNHTMALDAKTGALLWRDKGSESGTFTAPPFVAKGRVFQGTSQCGMNNKRCSMSALDAKTGADLWSKYTTPGDNEPGVESWGKALPEERTGAGIWSGSSYDYERNQILFGTGNTYSVKAILRDNPLHPLSALYTNSTLKLDAKTGNIVWHYQHFPGDVWDEDWAFERMIMMDPRGSGRTVVVTLGKLGIIDALDLETGRYMWSIDLGMQDIVMHIDPQTGVKTYDSSKIPVAGEAKHACPFAAGVRNWPATSYDPNSGLLFVPMLDACMEIRIADIAVDSATRSWMPVPRSGSNAKFGKLGAIDLKTGELVWVDQRRSPYASAILATGGGIIFEGSRDRWFRARESATGNVLWQIRLHDTPASFPITYMADGKQYVAVISGGGTYLDAILEPMTPEIEPSIGRQTLWVFALDRSQE